MDRVTSFCLFPVNRMTTQTEDIFALFVDRSEGSTALHTNCKLCRGEGVGGLIRQDLREQQAAIRHVSSMCIHQRRVDLVGLA